MATVYQDKQLRDRSDSALGDRVHAAPCMSKPTSNGWEKTSDKTLCHKTETLREIHAAWESSLKAHSEGHSAESAQSQRFFLVNICAGCTALEA